MSKKGRVDMEQARALIVEDNEENLCLLEAFLHKCNFTISTVRNGQEAVDAVRLATDRGGRFDIILMDLKMPIMDGYIATKIIREMEMEKGLLAQPILALTANSGVVVQTDLIKEGFDQVLFKPIDQHTLLTIIQGFLMGGLH